MSRRKVGKENIRNLQQTRGSYLVSLPIKQLRELGWQEHQRVVVRKSGNKLIIEDYKT